MISRNRNILTNDINNAPLITVGKFYREVTFVSFSGANSIYVTTNRSTFRSHFRVLVTVLVLAPDD